jgi:DHA2 family multidrug resistance protein
VRPHVPALGLLAVLLASLVVTLTSRLSAFGLADVRGALSAGFDEGAWIPTSFSVAQMVIGPITIWLARIAGPRRVLFTGVLLFGLSEALLPLCRTLAPFIVLQVLAGLGSGTFVPLTISYILQNVPRPYWSFGIGAYAMNIELSVNIAATIEGWWVEHVSWHWMYWQNAVLALPLLYCVLRGMPRVRLDHVEARRGDFAGMALGGAGLALVYAALDHGERLHWLDSPLVLNLLIAGTLLLSVFFVQQATTRRLGLDLSLLARENLAIVMALVLLLRILITAVGYLIPQYLGTVKGFRPLEIGDVFLWVALPQFVVAPLVAQALRHIDARNVLAGGIALMALAFWQAGAITTAWSEGDFVVSQLMQAVGQTAALTSLIFFSVQNFGPRDAMTFGALLQAMRLFGGEVGVAASQTITRVQEQQHSHALWDSIAQRSAALADRLAGMAAALQSSGQTPAAADVQALALLDRSIRAQAYTLACSDGFKLCAAAAVACLVAVALLRKPR